VDIEPIYVSGDLPKGHARALEPRIADANDPAGGVPVRRRPAVRLGTDDE